MAGRRTGIWSATVVLLTAGLAGVAAAQTSAEEQYAAPADEVSVLEAQVEVQSGGVVLLEHTARARTSALGEQTRSLERELAARRETFEAAKAEYQEKARAAYKGGDLEGLSSLLGGVLGSADGLASVADPRLAEILLEGALKPTRTPRSCCGTPRARSPRKSATTRTRCKKSERRQESSAAARRLSRSP